MQIVETPEDFVQILNDLVIVAEDFALSGEYSKAVSDVFETIMRELEDMIIDIRTAQ